MIINSDGKIAYHTIRFREDGYGSEVIQYDFDGKELYRRPFSPSNPPPVPPSKQTNY